MSLIWSSLSNEKSLLTKTHIESTIVAGGPNKRKGENLENMSGYLIW